MGTTWKPSPADGRLDHAEAGRDSAGAGDHVACHAADRFRASRPSPERSAAMPVKLGSKLPTENAEARIEIVPLIDIMFFLLASFMLVSLSMVNIKSVKVNLPTAATATPDVSRKGLHGCVGRPERRRLPGQEADRR